MNVDYRFTWARFIFHNTVPLMMMIAFIIFNSDLVLLIEGLCSSNPCEIEFSVLDGIEPTT